MNTLETNALFQSLLCEQIGENQFLGRCERFSDGHLFGGLAIAQAISAAQATVKQNRFVHSIESNFLRPGNNSLPISYEVERSRDGASYSSRRIVASQEGREIIHLTISLRDYKSSSAVYVPCELPLNAIDLEESKYERFVREWHANWLEVRILLGSDSTRPNATQTWLKAKEKLPDLQRVNSALLAYFSDFSILPSHIPIIENLDRDSAFDVMTGYRMSTLNHSMKFYQPLKSDDWLFYECTPEYTSEDSGLAHGRFYTRDGTLIASATQEGVFRPIKC